MFERFTERARQVVVLAQEEARTLHHDYIGTEHILLGCVAEGEGLAAKVLDHLQVSESADGFRDTIRRPFKYKFHEKSGVPVGYKPPSFTPEAKKVLELALREALGFGHNYVGTEHILLGLVREPGEKVETFLRETIDDRWAEHIRLETAEALKGPPKKDTDLTAEDVKELHLKDVLADLMVGFQLWRDSKVEDATWTDADEAFSRWVEGSNVADFL